MGRILSPPSAIMTYTLPWRPLISSKDQEENLVAGEKNPFPQLRRRLDGAKFNISIIMESGMPNPHSV